MAAMLRYENADKKIFAKLRGFAVNAFRGRNKKRLSFPTA
jgi:hypothetical protein